MSAHQSAPGNHAELTATAGRRQRRTSAAQLANRMLGELVDGRLAQLPVAIRFWDGSMLTPRDRNGVPVVVANGSAAASIKSSPLGTFARIAAFTTQNSA